MNKGAGNRNGTQLIKPKQQTKKQTKVQQKPKPMQQTNNRNSKKGPIRIGDNTDPDKWRCKTCKHLNDVGEDICTTCDDPRSEKK